MELSELGLFDGALLTSLQKSPEDQLDLFEAAANDVLRRAVLSNTPCSPQCRKLTGVSHSLRYSKYRGADSTEINTTCNPTTLAADHVGKLIKVSGIIVSVHAPWIANQIWGN